MKEKHYNRTQEKILEVDEDPDKTLLVQEKQTKQGYYFMSQYQDFFQESQLPFFKCWRGHVIASKPVIFPVKREWLYCGTAREGQCQSLCRSSFSTKTTRVQEKQISELQDILPGALINQVTCISHHGLALKGKKFLGGKRIEGQ